jgi:CheY-like chemotaxis protein
MNSDLYRHTQTDLALPILVVEDNEDLREGVAAALELEGYLVKTAANGLLALEAVAHAQFALILLDITMPVMNGLEFLGAYVQQPGSHSPIIVTSAEADLHIKALPPLVKDVLSKPFDIGRLLMLVSIYTQPVWGEVGLQ